MNNTPTSPTSHPPITPIDTGPNIDRLTDTLWTGGDLPHPLDGAAEALEAWDRLGIRHIFDARMEWTDEDFVESLAPHIRYLNFGVDDAGQQMPDWWFDQVVEFVEGATERGGAVLIHCHMGINRGPSAAFAALLASGWDPIDAIDRIRTARPIAAVGYAEDALGWWHRRNRTPPPLRRQERDQLAEWRQEHPHDTIRIIREIRESGRG
jgi:dual specificity phosphatase 3